jgi:hypothetical protein
MGNSLRLTGGKSQCRTTAEREADDCRARYLESVEDANEIARQMTGGIIRGNGRSIGQAVTALIVSDDAEPVRLPQARPCNSTTGGPSPASSTATARLPIWILAMAFAIIGAQRYDRKRPQRQAA